MLFRSFSLVKNQYKKLVLQRLIRDVGFDTDNTIQQSIGLVEQEKVKRCVGLGIKCILNKAQEVGVA